MVCSLLDRFGFIIWPVTIIKGFFSLQIILWRIICKVSKIVWEALSEFTTKAEKTQRHNLEFYVNALAMSGHIFFKSTSSMAEH